MQHCAEYFISVSSSVFPEEKCIENFYIYHTQVPDAKFFQNFTELTDLFLKSYN